MGALSFLLFLSLGGGLYYYMQRGTSAPSSGSAPAENASPAASVAEKAPAAASSMQKSIEIVGIRWTTQDKKPAVKFVVVNHANSEIAGLEGTVTIFAGTSKTAKDAVGTVSFRVKSIAAFGSQDVTQPIDTSLKPYELPDWQVVTTQTQITAP